MVSFVKESTLPDGNFLNHVLAQSVRVVGNILHIAVQDVIALQMFTFSAPFSYLLYSFPSIFVYLIGCK